jgi:GNAT superfamily N-acetyltransferase
MATIRPLSPADLADAQSVLMASCRHDHAGLVAEEKLFGNASGNPWRQTLGAFENQTLCGVAVVSGRWLRLLAVLPSRRKKGIGTALLEAVENAARTEGVNKLRTLDQPGNYLAPGIATKNTNAITWLEKRGYKKIADNTNLLIDVVNNDRVTSDAFEQRCRKIGAQYQIFSATPNDLPSLVPAITSAFSAGWAFEVENAVKNPPGVVHVARAPSGEWAAFAAHDGNNRGLGWFGPTGTFEAHRGRGLGAVLLLACLLDIARDGHETATIAWIGPREFYEKTTGVIGETRFAVLEKALTT